MVGATSGAWQGSPEWAEGPRVLGEGLLLMALGSAAGGSDLGGPRGFTFLRGRAGRLVPIPKARCSLVVLALAALDEHPCQDKYMNGQQSAHGHEKFRINRGLRPVQR